MLLGSLGTVVANGDQPPPHATHVDGLSRCHAAGSQAAAAATGHDDQLQLARPEPHSVAPGAAIGDMASFDRFSGSAPTKVAPNGEAARMTTARTTSVAYDPVRNAYINNPPPMMLGEYLQPQADCTRTNDFMVSLPDPVAMSHSPDESRFVSTHPHPDTRYQERGDSPCLLPSPEPNAGRTAKACVFCRKGKVMSSGTPPISVQSST